jgi:hypothetical protein
MSSRRSLASVAEGAARAFTSRSNDVEGWWALGLLLAAVPPTDPAYRVDLLTGVSNPALEQTELAGLGSAWARYLRWSVERHGVSNTAVRSATLTVQIDLVHSLESSFPGGPEHSFVCTVFIEDNRGHRYERRATGHCGRLSDFVDASPDLRPRRSSPRDPGRMSVRMTPRDTGDISKR